MSVADLNKRVAMVTGAGSGIGQEICRQLAASGAHVVAVDLDVAAAQRTIDALGAGSQHLAIAANVVEEASMQAAVDAAVKTFGSLDIAVNAAGVGISALMVDTTMAQWQRIMDVCLTGVFVSAKVQAKQMAARGRGVIVNIASTNSQQAGEGLSAYCAAKAGVDMFTKVAALELASQGVRVVAVGPGLTDTPMVARLMANPVARDAFLENIPLARPAQPSDIAAMVVFLTSDLAAYITGQTLYVDGGASLMKYPSLASRSPSSQSVKQDVK